MKSLESTGALMVFLFLSAVSLNAAAATKYAVLSLIGDAMTLVTYAPQVGSRLDTNQRDPVALKDPVYDRAAARAVELALQKADPQSTAIVFASSSPALFSEQRKLFEGSRVVLGDDFGASLRKSGATHLFLLTKHRAEARLGKDWTAGSGYLEGLGFYIDRQLVTQRNQTGEEGYGFLAPYVYIKVSLIDLASSTIVGEEAIAASRAVSLPRSQSRNPWEALTPEQKATALRELIESEVDRVVPQLLASAKR